jgi:hypothetical protein
VFHHDSPGNPEFLVQIKIQNVGKRACCEMANSSRALVQNEGGPKSALEKIDRRQWKEESYADRARYELRAKDLAS